MNNKLQKIAYPLLFISLWLLWRYFYILHINLNADTAVTLLMAERMKLEGWTKFMWGQNYLGTVEALWNYLCFSLIKLSHPQLLFFNSLLGLACDFILMAACWNWFSRSSRIILAALLIFTPSYILDAQINPCYSYTTLTLLCFLALFSSSSFLSGLLLGLAFYVQPISIYFIGPIFLIHLLEKNWKRIFIMILGFSIPLIWALSPVSGPGMVLVQGEGKSSIISLLQLLLTNFLNFFGANQGLLSHSQNALAVFLFLLFTVALFKNRNSLRSKIQNASPFQKRLVLVFILQIFFIPLIFLARNHGSAVDLGMSRYLWLWHYPLYFLGAFLLGQGIGMLRKQKLSLTQKTYFVFSACALIIIFSLSLRDKIEELKKPSGNGYFLEALDYLRKAGIQGAVGDYWCVYPLSHFSSLEPTQPFVYSFPLAGIVRNQSWGEKISEMDRVAYLCLGGEPWCKLEAPSFITVGKSSYEKEEDPNSSLKIEGGPSIQIYKKISVYLPFAF